MKIFSLLTFVFAIGAWAADRPNVIVIFTDDQGYGDLSCHGNPILETPHPDNLHSESVRFDNFHVALVCTLSRSELMTGLYAMKQGGNGPRGTQSDASRYRHDA